MSVVERQQGHIDALQKVCALGEVWSSVAAEFASSADPSVKFYRDTVNRCSTVMAWISVNCLKCISHDHHDEPVICEIGEDAFRIDVFAREVAAQLCAADTAVRARDAENALLRDRVRSLQTDLSSAQREAAHSRLSSERAAMDREDLHSAFRYIYRIWPTKL